MALYFDLPVFKEVYKYTVGHTIKEVQSTRRGGQLREIG
jgi:hypothetical protein